ncbi:MAG: pyruvate kinase [Bacteroidetes bacterium]|nr:MAG: pyruvate kinase [Bacteroidota bacterium]
MDKLTKIVATISDKYSDETFLREMISAGVDVVRINTAHQQPEDTLKIMQTIKRITHRVPILIDTKGPEIRTVNTGIDIEVYKGQTIRVAGDPDGASSSDCLFVNYKEFVASLEVGKSIMIDDGDIELEVKEKHEKHLICEVKNKGLIKPRKSINLPGSSVTLPSLSPKDLEYIMFSIEHDIDFIAHSFVRNKEDVLAIQEILDKHNSQIKIIAKIENQQGIDNIDEILDHVYGIMVARGDLAIEVPAEKIPGIQAKLVAKCIKMKKAVIVATQMLHSMIENPRPTRAEITDIANAVFTGTDAVMLSGETAYGKYPLESVKTMARTAREAEKSRDAFAEVNVLPHENEISVFLSKMAVRSIEKLSAKAIITDTDTGKTARYLAAFRGKSPIYAQCYEKRVLRELALNYGIYADLMDVETSKKDFIEHTLKRLLDKGELHQEDLVAVLAGNFGKKSGPSFVEISTVSNMLSPRK